MGKDSAVLSVTSALRGGAPLAGAPAAKHAAIKTAIGIRMVARGCLMVGIMAGLDVSAARDGGKGRAACVRLTQDMSCLNLFLQPAAG